jgi:hypothetical protein
MVKPTLVRPSILRECWTAGFEMPLTPEPPAWMAGVT